MKKYGSKIFAVLLALTMVFAMTVTSFAADDAPTKYTVRVFSGDQGTLPGEGVVKNDANLGDTVTVDISKATVNDSKYYVKGLKDAGKDNNEYDKAIVSRVTDTKYNVKVEKDIDCVVMYGIKDKAVAYTVNYFDQNNNKLAESQTFYGDVGDHPVVSYRYIDGYVPAANNLTKTLVADESQNVFTFYYRKAAPGENTTVVVVNGNNNANGNNANATNGANNGANAANGNANANAPDNQTPRDLVNLDDEETPMANMDLDEESGLSLGAILGIIAAAIAVGAAILILVAKKRRKDEEEAYNE